LLTVFRDSDLVKTCTGEASSRQSIFISLSDAGSRLASFAAAPPDLCGGQKNARLGCLAFPDVGRFLARYRPTARSVGRPDRCPIPIWHSQFTKCGRLFPGRTAPTEIPLKGHSLRGRLTFPPHSSPHVPPDTSVNRCEKSLRTRQRVKRGASDKGILVAARRRDCVWASREEHKAETKEENLSPHLSSLT
jgi:hypothetical protein